MGRTNGAWRSGIGTKPDRKRADRKRVRSSPASVRWRLDSDPSAGSRRSLTTIAHNARRPKHGGGGSPQGPPPPPFIAGTECRSLTAKAPILLQTARRAAMFGGTDRRQRVVAVTGAVSSPDRRGRPDVSPALSRRSAWRAQHRVRRGPLSPSQTSAWPRACRPGPVAHR